MKQLSLFPLSVVEGAVRSSGLRPSNATQIRSRLDKYFCPMVDYGGTLGAAGRGSQRLTCVRSARASALAALLKERFT